MDYNEQQELAEQAATGEGQAREARRRATVGEADSLWQAGDRAAAMRVLYSGGFDGDDMIGFCRERALSDFDARAQVRASGIDWS